MHERYAHPTKDAQDGRMVWTAAGLDANMNSGQNRIESEVGRQHGRICSSAPRIRDYSALR